MTFKELIVNINDNNDNVKLKVPDVIAEKYDNLIQYIGNAGIDLYCMNITKLWSVDKADKAVQTDIYDKIDKTDKNVQIDKNDVMPKKLYNGAYKISTETFIEFNNNDYFALIMPRSSSLTKGIQVIPGVIDSDYRGELFINAILYNVNLNLYDRIAQIVILPNLMKSIGKSIERSEERFNERSEERCNEREMETKDDLKVKTIFTKIQNFLTRRSNTVNYYNLENSENSENNNNKANNNDKSSKGVKFRNTLGFGSTGD